MKKIHKKYLLLAHTLAKKQFGKTFPNPSVGCVLVKNNKILSMSSTGLKGRPHAEEIVLKRAGKKSIGSTMYVTLEPCYHNSIFGSCANQIVKSKIKDIYISKIDPDLRTNRKSIQLFKKNSIKTYVELLSNKLNQLNKFYFVSTKLGRPYIKVKMAISKDEKIARQDFSSKWISNSKSRLYAHSIRNNSQAILTTAKTVIKDNPRFTVRKNNKIIRYLNIIVIDCSLKIPLKSKILKNLSKKRIIIFTSKNNKKSAKLEKLGCKIIKMKKNNKSQMNLKNIFKKIYQLQIRDILVEAGGVLFTQLIKTSLIDELHIFRAPIKIGNHGIPLIIGKSINDLNITKISKKRFGNDQYSNYVIKP